jgi:hypothetical protein
MKTERQIQLAHDLIAESLMTGSLEPLTDTAHLKMEAAMDVFCWVLNHRSESKFVGLLAVLAKARLAKVTADGSVVN